jgi:hypothetical protein
LFTVTDNGTPILSDTKAITIVVDVAPPPTLTPIGPQQVDHGKTLTINLSGSEPNGLPLAFGVSNAPSGYALVDHRDGTAVFTWQAPEEGPSTSYDVLFTVTSEAGSDQEQVSINVGNGNRTPILNPIGARDIKEGTPLEIILTARDLDLDHLSFAASAVRSGAVLTDNGDGSARFTWTPTFEQAGNYSVTFSVTDDGQTDGVPDPKTAAETAVITVGDVNHPPKLDPVYTWAAQDGVAMPPLVLSAHDLDGGTLRFTRPTQAELPQGATFKDNGNGTAQLDWTPPVGTRGEHPLTFEVTDNGDPPLSASMTVRLQVSPTENPPSFTYVGGFPVEAMLRKAVTLPPGNVGIPLTIQLSATDPDGGNLMITSSNELPAGSSFPGDNHNGGAVFSWTPTVGQKGSYSWTFLVTDSGALTDTATVSVEVFDSGDIDQDGDVDQRDLDSVLNRLDQRPGQSDPADVDQDGAITVLDARRLILNCTRNGCANQ